MNWLEDKNGNKCSVEYFGSQEAAQKALESLKGCKSCTNCSRCFDCSRCYKIHPARFFDSNEDALADMKRLAEEN